MTLPNWKSPQAARVLVLGTFHFANPGLDLINPTTPDVLSPQKQSEIADVLDSLARFQPNKVAVEAKLATAARTTEQYRRFCAGDAELDGISLRNETVQLGFALASRLQHSQVYPIDVPGPMNFQPSIDHAAQHQPDAHRRFLADMSKVSAELQRLHEGRTICEALRVLNDPSLIAEGHDIYLNLNQVGAGCGYQGAKLIAGWYERNLRIFANLQRLLEPGDRILLLYGSGHAAIFRDLISSYRDTELIEALDFL